MKTIPQVDLLLDKYKKHLLTISKEQEKLALSYDDDDDSPFTITIELTKSMVKRFIRYYNLTCLYEYLDDKVTFTSDVEKYDEYYKQLCKVHNTLTRLKDNFYREMSDRFIDHTVALFDFEDDDVGECESDLMTMWAESVDTQIQNYVKVIKQENDDDEMD